MSQSLLKLEVFETAGIGDAQTVFDPRQAEKLRETAFEQGYAAGWQDALEHMRNEDALRRIAAEEALQAVSFGYHEAHAALQAQFLALMQAILAQLMPETVRHALPSCLEQELAALVRQNTRLPVEILCAPEARSTLEPIIAQVAGLQVDLIPEPSFSEAQVALRLGAQERRIDLDGVLAALGAIFERSLQRHHDKEREHG